MRDDVKAINTPLCYGCDYADYEGNGYCYMFINQPFVIPCAQYAHRAERKEANHDDHAK
jgi:hypothetical protein